MSDRDDLAPIPTAESTALAGNSTSSAATASAEGHKALAYLVIPMSYCAPHYNGVRSLLESVRKRQHLDSWAFSPRDLEAAYVAPNVAAHPDLIGQITRANERIGQMKQTADEWARTIMRQRARIEDLQEQVRLLSGGKP